MMIIIYYMEVKYLNSLKDNNQDKKIIEIIIIKII